MYLEFVVEKIKNTVLQSEIPKMQFCRVIPVPYHIQDHVKQL